MLLIKNLFFQTIYGLPAAGGIFLAYVMPAYLLGGLHNDLDKDTFVYYSGNLKKKIIISIIIYILTISYINEN